MSDSVFFFDGARRGTLRPVSMGNNPRFAWVLIRAWFQGRWARLIARLRPNKKAPEAATPEA
nr:hypothetical protein 14 [bacterium]